MSKDSKQKIGWIGLGKMGVPMVQNLVKDGYQVLVYNRSLGKSKEIEGENILVSTSIADLVVDCEMIFLMVSDDQAIEELFETEDGLLASSPVGKIFINMSTVSPTISKKIAAKCINNNSYYLDAPVSGSVKQATDGTLVIMVGGDPVAFKKVEPVFGALGKLAMNIGESGAGNVAKLAINTLLSFHAQGLAEAISFAQERGIAAKDLTELINNSAIGNIFMKIKGDAILQNNFQPAFALKHIVKDLRLAKAEGLDSPLGNAALQSFEKAESEYGNDDIIAIYKALSSD